MKKIYRNCFSCESFVYFFSGVQCKCLHKDVNNNTVSYNVAKQWRVFLNKKLLKFRKINFEI